MKKTALKFGTRVRLIKYAEGYPEGSIFVISSFYSDMQKNYEYECYLESDNEKRCNFFDDEFEVI